MWTISRDTNPGQMRTRIRILRPVDSKSPGNYRKPKYENIYPDDRSLRCKWVSAFGTEAVTAQSLGVRDQATLTLRYDPRIRPDCIVENLDTGILYDLVSAPNDVAGAHRWMELRVKGRVKSL